MDLENGPLDQQGQGNKYEVFLSFSRGEETQESFASLLYSSLRKARISVFKDDIPIELLRSIIEGCKISIIIFSKHYASSRRCLEEFTKLMEFRKAYDQLVFPIFFGVNRYEVRNQESSFGEAFRSLIGRISPSSKDEESRWITNLSAAGGNYGYSVPNYESKNEREIIENIVESVRKILDRKSSPFATEGLIGVSSQLKEVIKMLHKHESKNIVFIGIWGTGGIGKTTLAKVIFEHIQYEFEGTCFLSNVREAWERKGKAYLQKELFSVICEATEMRIDSVDSGSLQELKVKPCYKKLLIVVDDVNHLDQLDALCGSRKWFGEGSRIIITTGDLHLLQDFQVDDVYKVKFLSNNESLELFSRKAFKQVSPKEEFIELSRRMVSYTKGQPLALEILGSFLFERSSIEWESALTRLSTCPSRDTWNILKLSFDYLDGSEKEIFLNIVLLYVGEDMNDVIHELDGRGYNASNGIRVLVDRSLVTIDNNNKLGMHNVVLLLGREIIRQNSQKELPNRDHTYDVFLSFRGKDTRTTFIAHLHTALCDASIHVFKDDCELDKGSRIDKELSPAIRNSKIAIIVFSKEYAGSRWCLEEMSIIMEFHKSNDQVILPVFYGVDPSDIRHQTSSFGEAFEDLLKRISPPPVQISKWRAALREAGNISGFVVLGSRNESEEVNNVVTKVCDILNKNDLFVVDHPVGVEKRVQEVITIINNQKPEDVVMVGIWGMGGIGKTTVAKAIYNAIGHRFEGRSFLSKIRKNWDQRQGKVRLQKQLLTDMYKTIKIKISSVESGKNILSGRLRHKKALLVLDDVDKPAQLDALVGSCEWFKPGSVIIITTRNKRLLKRNCLVYTMKNLDKKESIELFRWHAFKKENPKEDFVKLSESIVSYSGGLPLALKVLGSFLFDREVKEWKRALKKLKKIPNEKIQKKLKISFDGLNDSEKDIFLDICCFFIGMDKNDVTQILNGCDFLGDIGIKTLVERSLITIDGKNELIGMHDLLRDMGREIIREKSHNELERRSRLWFHKDAIAVLLKHTGTKAIEGLSLTLSSQGEKMHFPTKAFKKMKRLRLLRLEDVQLKGNYKYISKALRWLCWDGFPVKHIPGNFYQEELVAIDLKYSNLRQVWKEPRYLKRLKILNLSHSSYLEETPDFSNLPNLEKLILKGCRRMSKVHHSIGLLYRLLLLDLEDCVGLHSLQRSIYRLKCLKTLILSGCNNIEKLEEDIEQMESLTNLIAPAIKMVPFSLVRLKSIEHLSICGYEGISNHVISSLFQSWISPTNNPVPPISKHEDMPPSNFCNTLNEIDGPSTIHSGIPSHQSLLLEDELEIHDSLCVKNYITIMRRENCLERLLIKIGKDSQVSDTLSEQVLQGLNLKQYSDDYTIPGDNYPYWLTFKGEGDSVKFKVPPVNGRDHLKGITICCVYFPSGDLSNRTCESFINGFMIINYTKTTNLRYMQDPMTSFEEAERKKIISNLESHDQVEVISFFRNGFTVKKTIVYLIYNESFDSKATNVTSTKRKYEKEEEAHQSIGPRKAIKF